MADSLPDDPITASFIGITVAISGNVLISLALNCQKLAHRRLDEQRQQQLFYGSSSYTSSSTETPVNLSRTNSNLGLNGNGNSGTHDTYSEERRPLLGPNRGHSMPVTSYEYGTAKDHLPHTMKNKVLLSLAKLRSYSASKLPGRGPLPDDVLSPVIEQYPRELSDEPEATEEDHLVDDDELNETPRAESDYLRSKLWWFGFILMNIGEIGNFLSYAYAPASVVAPLGTVGICILVHESRRLTVDQFALIANCVFAPLILGERFRKRDLIGIFLCILGALSVVSSAKPTDTRLSMEGLITALKQPIFITYSILSLIGSILLAIISEGNKGREWVWVDVGLCAIFGGYTVLATKGLSTLLSLELIGIFKEWITYPLIFILLGTGILQIRYLNRALMNFDSKIVIPTQFVFFNLAAIVGSAILYRDFEHVDFHTFVTFVYGCATTFLGVFILTWTNGVASEGKVAGVPGRRGASTSVVGTITTGTPLMVLDDPAVSPVMEPVGGSTTLEGTANAATAGTGGAAATRAILHAKGSRASLSISPGQYLLLAASPPTGSPTRGDLEQGGQFGSLGRPTRHSRARRRSLVMDNLVGARGQIAPPTPRQRTIQFKNDSQGTVSAQESSLERRGESLERDHTARSSSRL